MALQQEESARSATPEELAALDSNQALIRELLASNEQAQIIFQRVDHPTGDWEDGWACLTPGIFCKWEGPEDGLIACSGEMERENPALMFTLPWPMYWVANDMLRDQSYWRRKPRNQVGWMGTNHAHDL